MTDLLVDRDARVTTITLNRPGALNAFDGRLAADLRDAVRECGAFAFDGCHHLWFQVLPATAIIQTTRFQILVPRIAQFAHLIREVGNVVRQRFRVFRRVAHIRQPDSVRNIINIAL